MGEARKDALRLDFDHRLKLEFHGTKVTSDAGPLAYRELDEAFALTEMVQDTFQDSRLGSNKQHQLVPLLRQSIYSRLAGYEDVNDAERLSVDPAMRHVVGGRAMRADKYAASTSEVGRFETENLSTKDMKLRGLAPGTQRGYLDAVTALAEHYHRPPDQLSQEQIRAYLLYLIKTRKFAKSSFKIHLAALKFLYRWTLDRPWPVLELPLQ